MTIGRNRKYISGSTWAFWRWTDVPTGHIIRLHFIKTPWFAIDLHWIMKPDPEPFLHDHPVSFLSIILKGWYRDYQVDYTKDFRELRDNYHDWFNYIPATFNWRHQINEVSGNGCLTICFMGPKTREWGFHTDNGWKYWKDYYKENPLKIDA